MNRILIAYLVVAVLTFGYSYNADYRAPKGPWVAAEELNSVSALIAGIVWPLYWTTRAFSPLRQSTPPGERHLVSNLFSDIGFAVDRTTGKEDWLTPPDLLRALGEFDLDPCSPAPRPWDTARKHFTIFDDGLKQPWEGRVWMNPPYGNLTERWMERLADHGNGIALIFARTETATFFPWVWSHATALLFLKGRVRFYTKEGRQGGSAGAPSVLIAYGPENAAAIAGCGLEGAFVPLPKHSHSGSVD